MNAALLISEILSLRNNDAGRTQPRPISSFVENIRPCDHNRQVTSKIFICIFLCALNVVASNSTWHPNSHIKQQISHAPKQQSKFSKSKIQRVRTVLSLGEFAQLQQKYRTHYLKHIWSFLYEIELKQQKLKLYSAIENNTQCSFLHACTGFRTIAL